MKKTWISLLLLVLPLLADAQSATKDFVKGATATDRNGSAWSS